MEPAGSLPHPQVPATCPYSDHPNVSFITSVQFIVRDIHRNTIQLR